MKKIILSLAILLIQPSLFAKSNSDLSFEVLAPYTFSKLSQKQQKEYIDDLRKTWVEFEKNLPIEKVVSIPLWHQIFLDTAFADDTKKCMIGGMIRTTKKVGEKYVCPTTGLECSGQPNTFHCGIVFGGVCIKRLPVSGLSDRCYTESSSKPLAKEDYQKMVASLESNFTTFCNEKAVTNKDGCRTLADKMNQITKDHNIKFAALEEYNKHPIAPGSTKVESSAASGSTSTFSGTSSNWTNAYGVNIPGCSNGTVRFDKYGPAVPQFGLTADRMCTFESNRSILNSLFQKGCGVKNTSNLFATTFKPVDNSILFGESNSLSTIVENVSIQEQKSSDDILYTLQILKPNMSTIPTKIERRNISIRQQGARYFMLNPNGESTEVNIFNNFRPNYLIESQGIITNYPVTNYLDGKTHLADDCMLAQELKSNRYYESPMEIPGATAAGSK